MSDKYFESEAAKEALEQRLNHVRVLLTPPGISPVDNSYCMLLNTMLATCLAISYSSVTFMNLTDSSTLHMPYLTSNSVHIHVVLTSVDYE